jgi:hypothetical protein
MPTSLLKRLLNKAANAAPDAPQTICGSLAVGERVDIGTLRAVNDGGYLAMRYLNNDAMLRWVFSGPESEVCITNLGNRADEGVIFDRFGNDSWAFVAKVRPDHLVVFRPVPAEQGGRRKAEVRSEDGEREALTSAFSIPHSALPVPLVRTGQGEYSRDWPEKAVDSGQLTVDSETGHLLPTAKTCAETRA